MNTNGDLHVVLGATGGIGSALVEELVARGHRVRAVSRAIGLFSPFIRELAETMHQFEQPFYADASKYERAFGPCMPTAHEVAIGDTVAWFRSRAG